ncbi:hypothetical protein HS088_TW14G00975 [Tripterygium wilfordii]|uniref:Uncharacterized protein n=1 Tax=Tripterygium wilfordii TaxID=458696 RepID=A0A7J7CRV9_TRIWF|nr:hypothetical protein HS088_TW14G00975 [Tripterygium wilfordii]
MLATIDLQQLISRTHYTARMGHEEHKSLEVHGVQSSMMGWKKRRTLLCFLLCSRTPVLSIQRKYISLVNGDVVERVGFRETQTRYDSFSIRRTRNARKNGF